MDKESIKALYSKPVNVRAYYEAELNSLKWNGNGQGISLCPFHDDSKESLSVKDSGAYFCHACNSKGGDVIGFHMALHGVDFKAALNQLAGKAGIDDGEIKKKQKHVSLANIQKITFDGYSFDRLHTYKAGNPPYIKVIFKNSAGDKKGLFYSVTDNGLYVSGRKSEPVFYNQELITDNVKSVFMSESEKDCDTLLNVCNFLCISTGGATSWSHKLPIEILKDKSIILLSHNDQPGREYTKAAAQSLRSIASSMKIIELPGLPEKGDVSDWIVALQAAGKPAEVIKAELRQIVKAASEWQAPEATDEPVTEWPDPIPFNDYSGLPDFPVDLLPDTGRGMVSLISEVNQVDLGLTASIYLSALSACVGRKAKINLISHEEPLNTFSGQISPSGERKSATQAVMTKPLYDYQEQAQQEMKDLIRDSLNAHKIREARLAKLQKQAAHSDDYAQRKQLENEAAAVAKEIEENPVVKSPLYVMDDTTTEALSIHMADNNERMSIFSTEGGIFQTMAGRYDKGVNIDLYLKAHAGDPFSVHRVGREARTMQAPCLTMCLSIQPDVIKEIGKNEQFKGRGLLARILYVHCKSQVGYRARQIKTVPEPLLNRYRQHIFSLMEISPQAECELKFTPAAQGVWDEFYNDVETDMRPGGSLEYLTDWGSKLPGAVARIAGLLHFAEHGAEATTKDISAGIAVASCVIGAYFKEHALATFGLMQTDHRIESAKKILSYLKRQEPAAFKGRDVLANINSFKTIDDDVMPGIKVLIERGYIRAVENSHSGVGRPEATAYQINPKLKIKTL